MRTSQGLKSLQQGNLYIKKKKFDLEKAFDMCTLGAGEKQTCLGSVTWFISG